MSCARTALKNPRKEVRPRRMNILDGRKGRKWKTLEGLPLYDRARDVFRVPPTKAIRTALHAGYQECPVSLARSFNAGSRILVRARALVVLRRRQQQRACRGGGGGEGSEGSGDGDTRSLPGRALEKDRCLPESLFLLYYWGGPSRRPGLVPNVGSEQKLP